MRRWRWAAARDTRACCAALHIRPSALPLTARPAHAPTLRSHKRQRRRRGAAAAAQQRARHLPAGAHCEWAGLTGERRSTSVPQPCWLAHWPAKHPCQRPGLECACAPACLPLLQDVCMPEVNGIELLSQVKADANLRAVPVVSECCCPSRCPACYQSWARRASCSCGCGDGWLDGRRRTPACRGACCLLRHSRRWPTPPLVHPSCPCSDVERGPGGDGGRVCAVWCRGVLGQAGEATAGPLGWAAGGLRLPTVGPDCRLALQPALQPLRSTAVAHPPSAPTTWVLLFNR